MSVYGCFVYLVDGDDDEAPPAPDLDHHGQELGIGGAKVAGVRVPGDLDVVVAPLLLGRSPVNVPELGRPDAPEVDPSGHFE